MIYYLRFAIVVCLALAAPGLSMTYMGPPTSDLHPGQSSFGLEWATAETDIEISAFGYTESVPDVGTDLMMARFAVGIGEQSELFARLGLGEIEEMGEEFAWGAGLKLKMSELGPLSSGLIFQATNLRGDETVILGPYLFSGEMNIYQIQFGTGIVWEIGPVNVYGGPMVQVFTGELDIEGIVIDVENKPQVGGFGGLSVEIADNCLITGEFQATSDSWMAGVNVQFRFGRSSTLARTKEPLLTPSQEYPPIKGYQGHIDPSTGKMQVEPVPEDKGKDQLKVDDKGEPVKDKDGNFIFEPVPEK
jgi:hypothetical protein